MIVTLIGGGWFLGAIIAGVIYLKTIEQPYDKDDDMPGLIVVALAWPLWLVFGLVASPVFIALWITKKKEKEQGK